MFKDENLRFHDQSFIRIAKFHQWHTKFSQVDFVGISSNTSMYINENEWNSMSQEDQYKQILKNLQSSEDNFPNVAQNLTNTLNKLHLSAFMKSMCKNHAICF